MLDLNDLGIEPDEIWQREGPPAPKHVGTFDFTMARALFGSWTAVRDVCLAGLRCEFGEQISSNILINWTTWEGESEDEVEEALVSTVMASEVRCSLDKLVDWQIQDCDVKDVLRDLYALADAADNWELRVKIVTNEACSDDLALDFMLKAPPDFLAEALWARDYPKEILDALAAHLITTDRGQALVLPPLLHRQDPHPDLIRILWRWNGDTTHVANYFVSNKTTPEDVLLEIAKNPAFLKEDQDPDDGGYNVADNLLSRQDATEEVLLLALKYTYNTSVLRHPSCTRRVREEIIRQNSSGGPTRWNEIECHRFLLASYTEDELIAFFQQDIPYFLLEMHADTTHRVTQSYWDFHDIF